MLLSSWLRNWKRSAPAARRRAQTSPRPDCRPWDVRTGKELATLSSPDRVAVVAFSPDGKFLAAESKDGSVRIWAIPAAK